jgi:predicted TIM-barrel fold metal-dependent hydrolase
MKNPWLVGLLCCAGCTIVPTRAATRCEPALTSPNTVPAPLLDHHQHLLSEDERAATVVYLRGLGLSDYALEVEREPLVDADTLVRLLDSARIEKALVFSNAYYLSRTAVEQPNEQPRVSAGNDWTLAQIRKHPTRLLAACSINPLRGYATAEIERCAASGGFKALKIHFDASGIDYGNPSHVVSVRNAFATANKVRLPVVVHLQTEAGYGKRQARAFLDEILPAAPDIPVTINHLIGGGGFRNGGAEALEVFADAVVRKDPAVANLWFDLAQISMVVSKPRDREEIVHQMRRIGFARLLYGSDGPQFSGVPPKQHWEEFLSCMPLTKDELRTIATNVAPYLR